MALNPAAQFSHFGVPTVPTTNAAAAGAGSLAGLQLQYFQQQFEQWTRTMENVAGQPTEAVVAPERVTAASTPPNGVTGRCIQTTDSVRAEHDRQDAGARAPAASVSSVQAG
jgi:hypothetical protein